MTDGRILIGVFLCTDRDGNVILGSCGEYLKPEGKLFSITRLGKERNADINWSLMQYHFWILLKIVDIIGQLIDFI